ncbi:MAG: MBL fold metallo-hydrolase, partial [Verrucomicrobiota bacterium]
MSLEISIEDYFEDIIAKSMRGRQVTEAALASKTGVSPDILGRLCRGEFCDEPALVKVAEALQLDPRALTASASKIWRPRNVSLQGLEGFNTPYR